MEKDGFATALWEEGPLQHNNVEKELVRKSYEKVCLKYLYGSQNITADKSINKVLNSL